MVLMSEVFGEHWRNNFSALEAVGDITLRTHPEFPELTIANYTPKCAYEGAWNKITIASRGLIFDNYTGEILARPFAKFFNYGQAGAPVIDLSAHVYHVGNKFDGSLGIMYERPDHKLAIATRGSFDSDQARHATALINNEGAHYDYPYEFYRGDIAVGLTPLFEIIYPENRIVLDYGTWDTLVLLGWIRTDTGKYIAPTEGDWSTTFATVLERPNRPNHEGWVVWLDQYRAVKIKQEDYVALHKIVTGLNEKAVWREIQKGPEKFNAFAANLPDELQAWANRVGFGLALDYGNIVRDVDDWFLSAIDVATQDETNYTNEIDRKKFAAAVLDERTPPEYRGLMFSLLDGKDIQDKVWKMLEPKGSSNRPTNYSADEEA